LVLRSGIIAAPASSRKAAANVEPIMDLQFTPEQQAFRDEVREFLRGNLPDPIRRKILAGLPPSPDDIRLWQRTLHRRGWGAPGWPAKFGGTGWDAVRRFIFEEECATWGAPPQLAFGVKMVAPVIMAFGTPEQQQRHLPGILSGEVWWCQGYSEPGAGSDLASLKTRAVRQPAGDHYLVTGQKAWTTLGQHADWMFCLARTDGEAKAQRGISFLLIDMKSPGITVRPVITLDGAHEVNETWLEEVRVPVANLVGEENKGWTCAKFLLGHERANIAGIGNSKRALERLKRIATAETMNGRPLLQDPLFAARVAQVEIELMALEITNMRVLAAEADQRAPGPEASILKVKGTEIAQALSELAMQAAGVYALPFDRAAMDLDYAGERVGPDYAAPLAASYCNLRKLSIFGGSNEIQKNIVAQMILEL
jgi:alkylation response protein AidB-like acyl-CoA dehydrogenase